MVEERVLIDSLILAESDFLQSHIDDAYCDGSMWYCKYFYITSQINHDYNKSLKEIFLALNDNYISNYTYLELSDSIFEKEYEHIAYDLIPRKVLYDEGLVRRYDESVDRNAILNIRSKWNDFMIVRNEIAENLPYDLKLVWNNATYRFQRSHLILLKNEFEGLGMTNKDMDRVLLSDSCSYEELFAYPNYSTRWNEYLLENGLQ